MGINREIYNVILEGRNKQWRYIMSYWRVGINSGDICHISGWELTVEIYNVILEGGN
jgi:hypothetical protein